MRRAVVGHSNHLENTPDWKLKLTVLVGVVGGFFVNACAEANRRPSIAKDVIKMIGTWLWSQQSEFAFTIVKVRSS